MKTPIVITSVLLTLALTFTACSGEKSETALRAEACTYAQIEVESLLKSPSSADFPACSSMSITQGKGLEYDVNSYVEAQNSFGAQIRTEFTCSVKLTDGDTYYVSCDLDE